MHRNKAISLLFAVLCVLMFTAVPAFALNEPPDPDGGLIWNEDFTLESGEQVDGDLVVFNGDVLLEDGSAVDGDVIVWNGNALVDGAVGGELVVSNGDIHLGDNARVDGNVICSWACDIEQEEGAQVDGSVIESTPLRELQFEWGDQYELPVPLPSVPHITFWDSGPGRALSWVFKVLRIIAGVLAVTVVGGLMALIWPEATERVGRTVARQPLPALGIGLLAAIAGGALIVGLAMTICLSPVALLATLLLGAAVLFGWISLGALVGDRLFGALKAQDVTPLWSASIGTLVLTAATGGLSAFFCLAPLGWLVSFLVSVAGLGGVALTRFGTVEYAPETQQVSRPMAPTVEPKEVTDLWEAEEPEMLESEPAAPQTPEEPEAGEEA